MVYPRGKEEILMEPRRTRRYTKEFKIEALNLANELGSAAEAGRRLGITDSLIHNWRKQFNYKSEAKVKDATVAVNEAEEIKRLRKETEELKKTHYILTRAAAFFSQDHLK